MQLRPYQKEALASIERELVRHSSTLVSMATGTGKTAVIAALALRAADAGWHVLILAHREELLAQAARTLLAFRRGASLGLVKQEREDWGAAIVVASVQSLTAARLERAPPFHLIITDEAHHSPTPSYQAIYRRMKQLYAGVRHVGMTATPYRAEGSQTALLVEDAKAFESLAYSYGLREAMRDGWLVPELRAIRIPTGEHIRSSREGDFSVAHLNSERRNRVMVGAYRKLCPGLPPAIAFAASVAHARALAQLFGAVSIPAVAVWGQMEQEVGRGARQQAIEDYASGRIRVLCTVGLLTEGFDAPHTRVLLLGRPTSSTPLWMQMVGRVTRPYPGKRMGLLLEFTDSISERLNLHPAGLADLAGVECEEGVHTLFRLRASPS